MFLNNREAKKLEKQGEIDLFIIIMGEFNATFCNLQTK